MSGLGDFVCVIAFSLLLSASPGCSFSLQDISIIILDQNEGFNNKLALQLKKDVIFQAEVLKEEPPNVVLASESNQLGYWTILPLFKSFSKEKPEKEWVIFCLSDSIINIEKLLETLQPLNASTDIFLGHALQDKEPTILHHFSPSPLLYPYLPAGVAFSQALIKRSSRWLRSSSPGDAFSIDVGYELAKFVDQSGKGFQLTQSDAFCAECSEGCAVCPRPLLACKDPVDADSLYIGVKTFQGYHADRVPAVKQTWARHSDHVVFYSDVEDSEIPTKVLGVPNVVQGHCQKTMAILEDMMHLSASAPKFMWFAIVDDDTILSIGRLRQLLSCYNASEPLVIGERYGYLATDPFGYPYPTGGAGMVMSVAAVKTVVSQQCSCPAPSAPDDMHIGTCLQRFSIPIVHVPLFHQARPDDYALHSSPSRPPITFHKHFLVDPYEVYAEHFEVVDNEVRYLDSIATVRTSGNSKPVTDNVHTEL